MRDRHWRRGFPVDFEPMSPEEVQRMMQFLLRQQAQFAADFSKHQEDFAKHRAQITDGLVGLTAIVGQVAAAQLRNEVEIRELREGMRETDARLNVVISMFERHLRDDHGQAPS